MEPSIAGYKYSDVVIALKDQFGEEKWNNSFSTKEKKLQLLQTLQIPEASQKIISIGDALSLLTELSIVSNSQVLQTIKLISRIIPEADLNKPLTARGFLELLLGFAQSNPNIKDEQKKSLELAKKNLIVIPYRELTINEFLRVCEALIISSPNKIVDLKAKGPKMEPKKPVKPPVRPPE